MSDATAAPASSGAWTRGDRRGLLALAATLGAAWAAAVIAASFDRALDALTWMPLLDPMAWRIATAALAIVAVVQFVRHWRAPDPSGDYWSFTLPVFRALLIGATLVAVAAAGDWLHAQVASRRAERIAEEWSARLDAGESPSQLALLDGIDDGGWRAWRRDVGTQDEWRWHLRREVAWIESREGQEFGEVGIYRRGDRREFVPLDRGTRGGRWFLITTTWDGDGPAADREGRR